MKILLYDEIEDKVGLETEYLYEIKINLKEEFPSIYQKSVTKEEALKFLEFLMGKVNINKKNVLNYVGSTRRVWSYLLIFAFLTEKTQIKYRERLVEESKILKLNLEPVGYSEKDLKKMTDKESYEKLPNILKNLYFCIDSNTYKLSKVGDLYAENLKNMRR